MPYSQYFYVLSAPVLLGIVYFLVQLILNRFIKEWSFLRASFILLGINLVLILIFVFFYMQDASSASSLGYMILAGLSGIITLTYGLCYLIYRIIRRKR